MKRTINSLQAGRGLAALAVVSLHSALAAHDFGRPFPGYSFLSRGYIGVDFFFVLSGFIIFHSTVGRDRSLSDYALARFRRVYLPYWPVGLAVAIAYSSWAAHHQWSWLPTLTLAPVGAEPALSVAWTLKHEVLFYTLFGLFYYADMLWLGLAAWAIGIALGPQDVLPFRLINLEFFFGIAAAMLYRSGKAWDGLMAVGGLAFLLWVALGAKPEYRLLVGLSFALVVAPIAQLERSHRLGVPKPLVTLGAASYSLYLVHLPVISIMGRLLRGHWWEILPAAIIASVIAGFAYHFAIELRVIDRRTNPETFQPT